MRNEKKEYYHNVVGQRVCQTRRRSRVRGTATRGTTSPLQCTVFFFYTRQVCVKKQFTSIYRAPTATGRPQPVVCYPVLDAYNYVLETTTTTRSRQPSSAVNRDL